MKLRTACLLKYKNQLALCDENGFIFHGQRKVVINSEFDSVAEATITFIYDPTGQNDNHLCDYVPQYTDALDILHEIEGACELEYNKPTNDIILRLQVTLSRAYGEIRNLRNEKVR